MAILYGMSNKEFWEEDPELLWAYRKSYMYKMKIQNELINYNSWLTGAYVFDAVWKSIYNTIGRKETQSPLNYIDKPYDFNSKPKTKEEVEKEERLKMEEKIKERNRQIKEMLKNKK